MTRERSWMGFVGTVLIVVVLGVAFLREPSRQEEAAAEQQAALGWSAQADYDVDAGRLTLTGILADSDTIGFSRAVSPRRFEFPADHGPHPDFKNEWWYYTGHLWTKTGDRYGFDPLMLAALAYQESGLDQSARSRAGSTSHRPTSRSRSLILSGTVSGFFCWAKVGMMMLRSRHLRTVLSRIC